MPRQRTPTWVKTAIPYFLLVGLLFKQWQSGDFFSSSSPQKVSTQEKTAWSVCFTPGEACTDQIVEEIDQARTTIEVQAYSFTSAPIAKALVEAHRRGINIQIILDKSQETEKYSSADFLEHAGIPTYIDRKHAIAHNKVMVIDAKTVITGSFNFTKAAQEKNAENMMILHDAELARFYHENWERHLQHSEKYGS